MREEEAKVEDGHKLMLYVEKENHSYGPMVTGSYMTKTYIGDFMEKRDKLRQQCQERLVNGEISPVASYMIQLGLGEADLAARVGISRRRLRRHLKPDGFASIPLRQIRRYAEIFAVPVADLFQIVVAGDGVCLSSEETASPFLVLTRADRGAS